jgi:hypothetical protein
MNIRTTAAPMTEVAIQHLIFQGPERGMLLADVISSFAAA